MANKPLDTQLVDRAVKFAVDAHAGTERRGKGFPYIIHPLEAMSIVAEMTKDPELLAAAALHDTVEDTSVTVDDIRREFGQRVSRLVEEESDKFVEGLSDEATWHDRKKAAIDRIARASLDAKMVAMGDKLSNLRAIWRDYQEKGDELWKIFHASDRSDHEWHYRGLQHSMSELEGTYPYEEFSSLLNDIFGPEAVWEPADMTLYKQCGEGFTAVSYDSLDGKTMLKLYSSFMDKSVPLKEYELSRHVENMGFRTPRALRLVTDGTRFGVEFERIDFKRSFSRAISLSPEKLEYYAARFAKLTRCLHSTPCDTSIFADVKDFWREQIEMSEDFEDVQKAKMRQFVDSASDSDTCLHGNLHIGNVITDGTEDYWIDLGDFRHGDPMFDIGMFYLVCNCNPEPLTRNLFHLTNMQMAEIWSIFCKAYFGVSNIGEQLEVNAKCAPYAALMFLYFGNRDILEPYMKDFIIKTLDL